MQNYKILLLAGAITVTSACATDDPNRRAKLGAGIGAVAGAVIGHQIDGDNGRFYGAAIGALAGGGVGHYMDRQQQALEQALANELGANQIRVIRIDEETLKVELSSEATFDVNSSTVKPDFRQSLGTLASVVDEYDKTAVHLLGHTDSTGTDSYNQQLSETRAESVSRTLISSGVNNARVRTAGFGETRPISSNNSTVGRSRNRRVEVYLKSIVEGREEQAFQVPA